MSASAKLLAESSAPEIEITPEMIEAGLGALFRFHISEPDDDEMREAVAAVFRSMIRVASECRS